MILEIIPQIIQAVYSQSNSCLSTCKQLTILRSAESITMKKTTSVTSILITYNHENSIRQALDSMLSQKMDFIHQISIFDDCSTDTTPSICSEYADRFPEIITFHPAKENLGVVENIYRAVSSIKTDFYAMLEGDDYWCDDNKLQKQVDALIANPDCSFCGHNTIQRDATGTEKLLFTTQNKNYKYSFPKRYNSRTIPKVHPSSRVFRSSCMNLDSVKFKDSVVWDSCSFWYFLSKGKLLYLNDPMSVYNYNGQGIFSGSNKQRRRNMTFLNLLNINEELEFKYNRFFMSHLLRLKHQKYLKLPLIQQIKFRIDIKDAQPDYHALKQRLRSELNKSGK